MGRSVQKNQNPRERKEEERDRGAKKEGNKELEMKKGNSWIDRVYRVYLIEIESKLHRERERERD